MNWQDFLLKIRTYKSTKIQEEKLNASTAMRLIFAGAFDSMVEPDTLKPLNIVATYRRMCDELVAALKSSAKLPPAKPKELCGIADIHNEANLNSWRFTSNPLVTYDLAGKMERELDAIGYRKHISGKSRPYTVFKLVDDLENGKDKSRDRGGPITFILSSWKDVFEDEGIVKAIESNQVRVGILGVVTSQEAKPYGDNKVRIVLKLFTGVEDTDDIVIWPDRNSGQIEPLMRAIVPNEHGIALISPKVWNGKYSASLVKWVPIRYMAKNG